MMRQHQGLVQRSMPLYQDTRRVLCGVYFMSLHDSNVTIGYGSSSDCVKRYQNVNSAGLINKLNRPIQKLWAWFKLLSKSVQCAWLKERVFPWEICASFFQFG